MSWLAFLKGALSLAGAVVDWLRTSRLLRAGAAEADAKAMRKDQADAEEAMRARAAAVRAFDDGGVPKNDPNRRH